MKRFFGSDDEGVSDEGGADSPADGKQGAEEAHLAFDDWSSDEEAGVQETAAPVVAVSAEHLPTDIDVTEEEISAMQGILDKGCCCANTDHIRSLPAEDLALHKKGIYEALCQRERFVIVRTPVKRIAIDGRPSSQQEVTAKRTRASNLRL